MESRKKNRIAIAGEVDWYHGSSVVRNIREGVEIDIREVATALCHIPPLPVADPPRIPIGFLRLIEGSAPPGGTWAGSNSPIILVFLESLRFSGCIS